MRRPKGETVSHNTKLYKRFQDFTQKVKRESKLNFNKAFPRCESCQRSGKLLQVDRARSEFGPIRNREVGIREFHSGRKRNPRMLFGGVNCPLYVRHRHSLVSKFRSGSAFHLRRMLSVPYHSGGRRK
jgi:hypothetical protein